MNNPHIRKPLGIGARKRQRFIHVIQGDFAITQDPNSAMTTVLGSCIATCMRDPIAGVGGMNHFLLPGEPRAGDDNQKFGVFAMECLINALLKEGASRDRLEAKIFGGARVVKVRTNIGEQNALFVEQFLKDEGIKCLSKSVGGNQARRLRYWPITGVAKQMLLASTSQVVEKVKPSVLTPNSGDMELF